MKLNNANISTTITTLNNGGVAILPTETVFGLAGRADHQETVDRLYTIKGRNFDKPLALCVENLEMANSYGHMSGLASELARAFWPGPLSLVVKARHNKLDSRLYGENIKGQKTISMRCPQSDWRKALKGLPLALTSANPSGKAAPLNIEDAVSYIGESVDAILEGPPCPIGLSSTILAIKDRHITILRQGSLGPEDFISFDIVGENW